MTPPYQYSCLIPFHLADPAGILFFGHAFTLFHQAFEHFILHQLECPWSFWFQNPEWIVPIRNAEAQYLHPLQVGQNCLIDISVSSLASSSFVLNSSFKQGDHCCSLKTVHVFCSRHNGQKMAIPEAIYLKLTACLPDPKPFI